MKKSGYISILYAVVFLTVLLWGCNGYNLSVPEYFKMNALDSPGYIAFNFTDLKNYIDSMPDNSEATIILFAANGKPFLMDGPITINNRKKVTIRAYKGREVTLKQNNEAMFFNVKNTGTVLSLGPIVDGSRLILDGQNDARPNGSILYIEDYAALKMYDGVVIRNNNPSANTIGSGVNLYTWSEFYMYGGTITGNTAPTAGSTGGGGVMVSNGSHFYMYGGTISKNNGGARGGGVLLWNSGIFDLYGGTIKDNTPSPGSDVYIGSGTTFNNFCSAVLDSYP